MTNERGVVGFSILMLALSAGCASSGDDDANPSPGGAGGTLLGTAGGSAGTTSPATAGTNAPPPAGRSGGTAGAAPMAGSSSTAGTSGGSSGAGTAGTTAAGSGGATAGGSGGTTGTGTGACCSDGDCLCHGDPPAGPTSADGPYNVESYEIASAGCVFYPTDAEPPFAAVTVSDGFLGTGGCGFSQTGEWGPLYASWGIVTMIIYTGSGDQPTQRGAKLSAGIEAFKMENTKSGSPLMGKLAGRYGTSGFSMGGGGTTYAAEDDPTLKTNVSIMAWTPSTQGIMSPSLYIFGSADTLAGTMGMASYRSISGTVPKMAVTVSSGHAGQPSSGGGKSGEAGLAWQKVFLENDTRWIPILKMVDADESENLP